MGTYPNDRPSSTAGTFLNLERNALSMRWRLQFGYDGSNFHGWASQPNLRTVEGEIIQALVAARIVPSATGHLEVASRTDRGVSARANALALESPLAPRALLRILNGTAPDLWFTAAVPFPRPRSIRSALGRTYRFFEQATDLDLAEYREAARTLVGKVDVRSIGRGIPASAPVWRSVHRMTVRPARGGAVVEVEAPSFVWGMVRKMVGACREVGAGRLPVERLRRAVQGKERLTLPMAEAEPLMLWEVRSPDPWAVVWRGPNRHQEREAARVRGWAQARSAVWATLGEGIGPESLG